MKEILVGTCGQVVAWERFFDLYDALEINSTFYRFPTPRQVKNWQKHLTRARDKGAFFSFKAHQLFTHPTRSPTWKRSEFSPEERKKLKDKVGCLRLNDFTTAQLQRTGELAEALGAQLVLFQLPSLCAKEKENFKGFLARAKELLPCPVGLEIRWEDRELLEELYEGLGVLPVFDPILEAWAKEAFFPRLEFLYLRLHGQKDQKGRLNYRYQYQEDELIRLKEELWAARARRIVVLFNNVFMKKDALRFKEVLSK